MCILEDEKKTDLEIRKIGTRDVSTFRWIQGMGLSSIFTFTYLFGPIYIITSTFLLAWRPSMTSFWVASPVLLSALLPPVFAPYVVGLLRPMVDYFEYEHILESSPVDSRQRILDGTENYLIVAQPHGVLSFTGICSGAVYPEFLVPIKTAVASAVLYTPIIKHVMGIFGLCDASKLSLKQQLKKTSVVLYVGGIAELFLSCPTEERVFLKKRKGFIKLALAEGVDVIPIYLFGNTSILTVVKTGLLAKLSRKFQVSLTYFWGKFGLPIPRDDKVRPNLRVVYAPHNAIVVN